MRGAKVLTVNEYEYEMARQKSGLDEAGMLALVETCLLYTSKELSLRNLDSRQIDLVTISPNDPAAMRKYTCLLYTSRCV